MAGSVYDSPTFRDLFGDTELGRLITDSAEIRAMLLVEGTLAKVQGDLGLIPAESAAAIHRASLEIQIDPAALAAETGANGVVIPALVAAFRDEMQAPEHAQFVHWGATSQDIIDTALILRLRQVVAIYEQRLTTLIKALGELAQAHADLPMAGRTWGQIATVTSFGAVVAAWGAPLIRHLDRLHDLKPRLLMVSLSGAAGTLSAMGDKGAEIRTALATALNLKDPGASWHSCRDTIAEFSAWMTLLSGTLGKLGEDLSLMAQSGIAEVTLSGGGSSTMPQKSNPVQASLLLAISRHNTALNQSIQGAQVHRQQRDGAAWISEWMALPQICLGTGRALAIAQTLAANLAPDKTAMRDGLDLKSGLIFAEALTFALCQIMPRPEAQAQVKTLCQTVRETGTSLEELAKRAWPEVELGSVFDPDQQLGLAPSEARKFATSSEKL